MYANLYVNLCEGINCLKSLPKQKTIIEDPDNIIQDFKTEVRFYFINNKIVILRGGSRGRVQGVRPPLELTCGFLIQLVFCIKRKTELCGLLVLK